MQTVGHVSTLSENLSAPVPLGRRDISATLTTMTAMMGLALTEGHARIVSMDSIADVRMVLLDRDVKGMLTSVYPIHVILRGVLGVNSW